MSSAPVPKNVRVKKTGDEDEGLAFADTIIATVASPALPPSEVKPDIKPEEEEKPKAEAKEAKETKPPAPPETRRKRILRKVWKWTKRLAIASAGLLVAA